MIGENGGGAVARWTNENAVGGRCLCAGQHRGTAHARGAEKMKCRRKEDDAGKSCFACLIRCPVHKPHRKLVLPGSSTTRALHDLARGFRPKSFFLVFILAYLCHSPFRFAPPPPPPPLPSCHSYPPPLHFSHPVTLVPATPPSLWSDPPSPPCSALP